VADKPVPERYDRSYEIAETRSLVQKIAELVAGAPIELPTRTIRFWFWFRSKRY
jgi:hypothetical protein